MRELAIRNTAQAFFLNEWLMLSGTEGKMGKDSTNIATDEFFFQVPSAGKILINYRQSTVVP